MSYLKPLAVENIDALRNLTGVPDKQLVTLGGYFNPGDGGGGDFVWLAITPPLTDNGGTVIVPGGNVGTIGTSGAFHRIGPGTRDALVAANQLDVRWFGAIPNENDATPGFYLAYQALYLAGAQQIGCLYAPAGHYRFATKLVLNGYEYASFTLKGDGPGATVFQYSMLGVDTCMIEVKYWTNGACLQDFSIKWTDVSGIINNPSVLWVHDNTYLSLLNIKGVDLVSSDLTGGALRCTDNTSLTVEGVLFAGGSAKGTQFFWESGSGLVANCTFLTANGTFPCWRMPDCNSIEVSNCFFQGGGPWKTFAGATVTSTSANFTITKNGHGFAAGDYLLLDGASHAGYNTWWRAASVTATTITVSSALNLGSDTVTLSTLWSCAYLGGAGRNVTESMVTHCLFNSGGGVGVGVNTVAAGAIQAGFGYTIETSGTTNFTLIGASTNDVGDKFIATGAGSGTGTVRQLIGGSVGLYLDAHRNNGIGEITIADSLFDYGYCAVFMHGKTNHDPGSSCSLITLNNCRPNGGPRDNFGCFRLEGVTTVSIDGPRMYPGSGSPKPGTGKIFNSIVISDGGQTYYTEDIAITGGVLTHKNSSALYSGAARINAVQFDGVNVKNVRVTGCGADLSSANAFGCQLINGSVRSNDLRVDFWTHGYATVYPSANQSIPSGAGTYLTQFDTLVHDDFGMWSSGAQDRLTVNQAYARVRCTVNVTWAGAPLNNLVQIVQQPASLVVASFQGASSGNAYCNLSTPPVTVIPGDYFQVLVTQSSGVSVAVLGNRILTNLTLEILE